MNKQKQKGSAYIIVVIALSVILLATLGFIFWQSLQKKNDTTQSTTTTSVKNEDKEVTEPEEEETPAPVVAEEKDPKVTIPENCINYAHTAYGKKAISYKAVTSGIVDKWVGCVTTPWVPPYKISIEFKADGTYSAKYIDTGPTNPRMPALYYGDDTDNPAKTYAITSILDNGTAAGTIVLSIYRGVTNAGSLKDIALTGNTLTMNFWYRDTYGPIRLDLVRVTQD